MTRPPFCSCSLCFHCVRDSKYLTLPDNHNTLVSARRKSGKFTPGKLHFRLTSLNTDNIHHLVKKMRQIKLFWCRNGVLFRRRREEKKQLPRCPGREKNGSVLPLPKYLLHFHRRFLPRRLAQIYHPFPRHDAYLMATLIPYDLLIVLCARVVCF